MLVVVFHWDLLSEINPYGLPHACGVFPQVLMIYWLATSLPHARGGCLFIRAP